MFARALQNMANLVLAVQKQKGEIVKLYGTKTVGYFDTDNMSQFFICSITYTLFLLVRFQRFFLCNRKGEMQERSANWDHARQSVS